MAKLQYHSCRQGARARRPAGAPRVARRCLLSCQPADTNTINLAVVFEDTYVMEGSPAADASPTPEAKAAKTVTKEQLTAMLTQEKFKKRFLKQKCAECGGKCSEPRRLLLQVRVYFVNLVIYRVRS